MSTPSSGRCGATHGRPDEAAHLLGKLITHVGPKRVVWGTDSLWYGSPQPEIVALRRFEFSDEGKGSTGCRTGSRATSTTRPVPAPTPDRTIRNGILGRNAAVAYGVDTDAQPAAISCDPVNALAPTTCPERDCGNRRLASNQSLGARPAGNCSHRKEKQWAP